MPTWREFIYARAERPGPVSVLCIFSGLCPMVQVGEAEGSRSASARSRRTGLALMSKPGCARSSSCETECEESLRVLPDALMSDAERRDEEEDYERVDENDPSDRVRPMAVIHNIVSTSVVHGSVMPIDLNELSLLLPCSSYDRRRFAAITVRIDKPKCTALLFTSGKLVVTGVKSWFECMLASLEIAKLMNSVMVGRTYRVINCDVQNIVAHTEIQLRGDEKLNIQSMYEVSVVFWGEGEGCRHLACGGLDLIEIVSVAPWVKQDMSMECTYQRNMFPGLILRAKESPVVLLCFYSGKVVLTGGKNVKDIHQGWKALWPVVKKYVY